MVTTGTWSATKINPNKGGTGVDSYAKGDILYAGAAIANTATTALSKLTIGTSGQVLETTSSGIPGWITATNDSTGSTIVKRDSSGNFSAGTITASLTGNVTGDCSGSSGSCTGNAATATQLASTPNNTTSFLRGDNTWSNTIVGPFNASSSESNRANINMVSVGDVPNDFYLGNNNANKWSITSRASDESYNLNVFSTASDIGYSTRWEYSTGKFYMLHGAEVSGGYLVISQPDDHRDYGLYGTYKYTKAATIWSMGTSYKIAADGSGLGNLYGAAYGYGGQAYLGSKALAGGHQFIWCENGGIDVALGSNGVWIRKNGGIYWDPYVESASDASDVTSIYQIASGVAGGTELRINQQNDATDCINLCTNAYIYLNSKRAFTINDSWLRINENAGFSSGTYFGATTVRTDGTLQVGSGGNAFYANSSGTVYAQGTITASSFYPSGSPGSNCYFGSGNGDGNGNGTANIVIRSWYGVGFMNGCTGAGTNGAITAGVDCRSGHIYANAVHNAVWNDYAECRKADIIEGGYCVTETLDGSMMKTTERLQPGCKLTSDTYGSIMGETDEAKTPIAVAGRVLVYPYRNRNDYPLGAAVCSAPNGTIDIMTRNEIIMYPERIVGTVSEIPTYEIWHAGGKDTGKDIDVNGRIWIYVK